MRRCGKMLITVLLLTASVSAISASVSFTPPGGKKMYVASLPLQPTQAAGKASAAVTMVCQADLTKGMLTIQAAGLNPQGVYTAHLVKTIPAKGRQQARTQTTGLGKAPYQVTVSAKGFGDLMADLSNCKDAIMQKLEVVEHPSKNPKDMKQTVVIFTGDLSKVLQGKRM